MRFAVTVCTLFLVSTNMNMTNGNDAVFESIRAAQDIAPSTDPNLPFWRAAHPVYAERGRLGELQKRYRTEVRSRWTEKKIGRAHV